MFSFYLITTWEMGCKIGKAPRSLSCLEYISLISQPYSFRSNQRKSERIQMRQEH